jgi:aryl-alcohol dehydrogenase-like predicted oxidoreductase
VLAQGDDVVPIPGTRNARRLEENVGAADVTLSEQQSVRQSPRDRSEESKDLFRTDLG